MDDAYRSAKRVHSELVNEQNVFTPVNIGALEEAKQVCQDIYFETHFFKSYVIFF